MRKILLCLLLCAGCQKCPEKVPPFTMQEFMGRDETIAYGQKVRRAVYRAKVPFFWKRIDCKANESIADTTKPIVSFAIEGNVILAVHTFPSNSLEERIPVIAQIQRWRKQLNSDNCHVEKVAQGGFSGLYFEGKNANLTLFAWSLQLDMEHYQRLHFLATTVEEEEHYKQMTADYTIKVSGPSQILEKHKDEILFFANSFALIQELPARI